MVTENSYTPDEARAAARELRTVAAWMRKLPQLKPEDLEARADSIDERYT